MQRRGAHAVRIEKDVSSPSAAPPTRSERTCSSSLRSSSSSLSLSSNSPLSHSSSPNSASKNGLSEFRCSGPGRGGVCCSELGGGSAETLFLLSVSSASPRDPRRTTKDERLVREGGSKEDWEAGEAGRG